MKSLLIILLFSISSWAQTTSTNNKPIDSNADHIYPEDSMEAKIRRETLQVVEPKKTNIKTTTIRRISDKENKLEIIKKPDLPTPKDQMKNKPIKIPSQK